MALDWNFADAENSQKIRVVSSLRITFYLFFDTVSIRRKFAVDSQNKVLIVEDELILREHLVKLLQTEGFATATCSTVAELEALIETDSASFDLVILDRLLHAKDVGQKIPAVKQKFCGARVMVVSAINTPSEKAAILDLGADDYIAKPFDGEELIARVRALLRRNSAVFRFANLQLHLEQRKLLVGESEIQLATKEFLLIRTFMQEPGKVFSKNYLYEKVWELSSEVESNALETTVTKLRRRLEDANSTAQIRNSRNVGYWIEE